MDRAALELKPMTSLFFYGSLQHIPLLEIVLGRPSARLDIIEAALPDHAVFQVGDAPYPMIAAKMGEAAKGVLLRSLSDEDIARLNFYEGKFDYALTPATVTTDQGRAACHVYFPGPDVGPKGRPWSLEGWIADWGPLSCNAAHEVMSHFGASAVDDIAHLMPFFRARGWARQMAAQGAPADVRSQTGAAEVTVVQRADRPDGFFRLEQFDVQYPRFDGTQSACIPRAAFVAYDAALVLPYDPVLDQVMLIEQMRYGPLMRGDPLPWVLEPIAGLVDAGEPPVETARREAVEEAGLHLTDIRPMVNCYASPGYSTEFFHCFLGVVDLSSTTGGVAGLASENEDIRSHVIPFDRAMALLDSGEINNGPLVMMLLWLAAKRSLLRAGA